MRDISESIIEAERLVISRLIQGDPGIGLLSESDFGEECHRKIFGALKSGAANPLEVAHATGYRVADIAKLSAYNPFDSLTAEYIGVLKKLRQQERLRHCIAFWHGNPGVGIEQVRKDLEAVAEASSLPRGIRAAEALFELARSAGKQGGEGRKGAKLPFARMDSKIGGLMPGNLVTIAGRPGSGKSALAMQMAGAASASVKALYASLEMLPRELAARLAAFGRGVPAKALLRGDLSESGWEDVNSVIDEYAQKNLVLTGKGRTVREIRALALTERPSVLVIDSVNLMRGEGESERVKLTGITREIKQIAIELQIAVIMLAQLNRGAEERLLPGLSDIKESGSIEEDSDVVLLLSTVETEEDFGKIAAELTKRRIGIFGTDEFLGILDAKDKLVMCAIRKNRNGEMGVVPLRFTARRFMFEEIEKECALEQRSMFLPGANKAEWGSNVPF
jgi:replicative DNA helicase